MKTFNLLFNFFNLKVDLVCVNGGLWFLKYSFNCLLLLLSDSRAIYMYTAGIKHIYKDFSEN